MSFHLPCTGILSPPLRRYLEDEVTKIKDSREKELKEEEEKKEALRKERLEKEEADKTLDQIGNIPMLDLQKRGQ